MTRRRNFYPPLEGEGRRAKAHRAAAGGKGVEAKSTNPASTKWASRSITKWRRIGRRPYGKRRGAPQARQGRKRVPRASRRSMKWDRGSSHCRRSKRQGAPKARQGSEMNPAPARALPWAVPACTAAGSRKGDNRSYGG